MPTPIQFSMELKQWYREGTGSEERIAGTVEFDTTGVYAAGEFFSVGKSAIKYVIDYGPYYALRTSVYIRLNKEDEVL